MANNKINIRQTTVALCQIAVCAALLCVLSPLTVPTPFGIGFTLQVFIVILTALVLKPLHALTAQLIYTLLGVIGLPVFSGYQSGFGCDNQPHGRFHHRLYHREFCSQPAQRQGKHEIRACKVHCGRGSRGHTLHLPARHHRLYAGDGARLLDGILARRRNLHTHRPGKMRPRLANSPARCKRR